MTNEEFFRGVGTADVDNRSFFDILVNTTNPRDRKRLIDFGMKTGLLSPDKDGALTELGEGFMQAGTRAVRGTVNSLDKLGVPGMDSARESIENYEMQHQDRNPYEGYRPSNILDISGVGRTVGSALGSSAMAIGNSIVGSVVGSAYGGPGAGTIAFGVAGFATTFLNTYGDEVDDFQKAGMSDENARLYGFVSAALQSATELGFGPEMAIAKGASKMLTKSSMQVATRSAMDKFLGRYGTGVLKAMARGAWEEGSEEAIQYLESEFAKAAGLKKPVHLDWKQLFENAAGGVIGGAALGPMGGINQYGSSTATTAANQRQMGGNALPSGEVTPEGTAGEASANVPATEGPVAEVLDETATTGMDGNVEEDLRARVPEDLSGEQKRKVQILSRVLDALGVGHQVLDREAAASEGMMDADGNALANGKVEVGSEDADDFGVLKINPYAEQDVLKTTGHELFHYLRRVAPDIYESVRDTFDQFVQQNGKYRKAYSSLLRKAEDRYRALAEGIYGDDQAAIENYIKEEVQSDLNGEMWQDEGFLLDLASEIEAKNQGFGARFLAAVRRMVDTVLRLLKSDGSETAKEYFYQYKKVKAAVANATAELSRRTTRARQSAYNLKDIAENGERYVERGLARTEMRDRETDRRRGQEVARGIAAERARQAREEQDIEAAELDARSEEADRLALEDQEIEADRLAREKSARDRSRQVETGLARERARQEEGERAAEDAELDARSEETDRLVREKSARDRSRQVEAAFARERARQEAGERAAEEAELDARRAAAEPFAADVEQRKREEAARQADLDSRMRQRRELEDQRKLSEEIKKLADRLGRFGERTGAYNDQEFLDANQELENQIEDAARQGKLGRVRALADEMAKRIHRWQRKQSRQAKRAEARKAAQEAAAEEQAKTQTKVQEVEQPQAQKETAPQAAEESTPKAEGKTNISVPNAKQNTESEGEKAVRAASPAARSATAAPKTAAKQTGETREPAPKKTPRHASGNALKKSEAIVWEDVEGQRPDVDIRDVSAKSITYLNRKMQAEADKAAEGKRNAAKDSWGKFITDFMKVFPFKSRSWNKEFARLMGREDVAKDANARNEARSLVGQVIKGRRLPYMEASDGVVSFPRKARPPIDIVEKFVAADDTRKTLRGVLVRDGRMVGTNGVMVFSAPAPKGMAEGIYRTSEASPDFTDRDGDLYKFKGYSRKAYPDVEAVLAANGRSATPVAEIGPDTLRRWTSQTFALLNFHHVATGVPPVGISLHFGGMSISYNPEYLYDVLQGFMHMGSDKLTLRTNGSFSMLYMTDGVNEAGLMPRRIVNGTRDTQNEYGLSPDIEADRRQEWGSQGSDVRKSLPEGARDTRFSIDEDGKYFPGPDEWGTAYTSKTGKGVEAIHFLINKREGFVPAAFHRNDIGDIDIVYGKLGDDTLQDTGGYGLVHILKRHGEIDWDRFAQILLNGIVNKEGSRLLVTDKKNRIVIALTNKRNAERKWVVTAYGNDLDPAGYTVVPTGSKGAGHRVSPKGLSTIGELMDFARSKDKKNTKFSLSKPVERVRDLLAVHNLKLADLEGAADLGGFAAPSIAVVKDTMGHEGYGPFSLLFHSRSIDPKASRDNHVFGRDAWTPTFPRIENRVDKAKVEEIGKEISGLLEKNGLHEVRLLESEYSLQYGLADLLETEDISELMKGDLGLNATLKAAYLLEKGESMPSQTTPQEITRRLADDNPDFRKWLERKYGEAVPERGVRNSRDTFTPSGNRRSWSELHDPVTLANIVKAMKGKAIKGGDSAFVGPEVHASQEFRNLDAVRKAEGRLRHMDNAEYDELKTSLDRRFDRLVSEYSERGPKVDDNRFINFDYARDMLLETYAETKGRRNALFNGLNEYNYKASREMVDEFLDIMDGYANLPTEYFEAKPMRPIGFEEVRAAIVPSGEEGAKAREILERRGVPVYEYDASREGDRLRVLNAAADQSDVRFSLVEDKAVRDEFQELARAGVKVGTEEEFRRAEARRTGKSNNAGSDVRLSLQKFPDGTPYVKIDTDQEQFDGLDANDAAKLARKIILERYQGKIIGEAPDNAFVNRSSAEEYAYPAKNLTDDLRFAKSRASTELNNVMLAGKNKRHVTDNGSHPEATGGWDYYDVTFQVGNDFFNGKINVMITDRGRLFHDVTDLKKDTSRASGSSFSQVHITRGVESTIPSSEGMSSQSVEKMSLPAEKSHSQVNPVLQPGETQDEMQRAIEAKYEPTTLEEMRRKADAYIRREGFGNSLEAWRDGMLPGGDMGTLVKRALMNSRQWSELTPEERARLEVEYVEAGTNWGREGLARQLRMMRLDDLPHIQAFFDRWLGKLRPAEREQVVDAVRERTARETRGEDGARETDPGIDLTDIPQEVADDPRRLDEVLRAALSARSTFKDKLYEYWINAILSGPTTHAANTVGNAANALYELVPKRFAEAVLNSALRRGGGASFGEFRRMWDALDMKAAWRRAKQAWDLEALDMATGKFDERSAVAIPGRLGRVIRAPGRFLKFADELAKSIVIPVETAAMAHRIGRARGLSGAELDAFVAREASDPNGRAAEWARNRARELTFQEDPGALVEHLVSLRETPGFTGTVLRFLLPFVKTPANLLRQGIRKSPLGTLSLARDAADIVRGRRTMDDAFIAHAAEQLIAWAAVAALSGLGAGDGGDEPFLTGTRFNSTPGERGFRARHLPAHSIRIGDTWYDYSRIEPLSTGLTIIANGMEALRDARSGKDATAAMREAITGTAKMLGQKSYLDSIRQAIDLVEDPEKAGGQWATSFVASWIPNAVRQVSNAMDDNIRDYRVRSSGAEFWRDQFHVVMGRAGLERPVPKVDCFGREVTRGDAEEAGPGDVAWRLLVPMRRVQADRMDAAERLIWDYNRTHLEESYWPSVPSFRFARDGERYQMSGDDYADFAREAGNLAHTRILNAIQRGELRSGSPTEADIRRMQQIFQKARKEVRDRFFREGRCDSLEAVGR